MRLYELVQSMQELEEAFDQYADENEGLLPDNALKMIEELQGGIDLKLEGIWKSLKNRYATIEALKTEEKELSTRRKNLEKRTESLEGLVEAVIGKGKPWQSGIARFSWRKSESISVIDESKIPDVFFKEKIERSLNKVELKAHIKEGGFLPEGSAELIQNQSLQIK